MALKVTCARNPALQTYQPEQLDIWLNVATGVPSLPAVAAGYPVIFGTATNTGNLTQAAIDAFLGSTSEIVAATAFGSTAMGTDSLGFVINLGGQAAGLLAMEATLYIAEAEITEGVTGVTTALTDALTTAVSITTAGNIYGRAVLTGFDAGSSPVHLRILWYPKTAG